MIFIRSYYFCHHNFYPMYSAWLLKSFQLPVCLNVSHGPVFIVFLACQFIKEKKPRYCNHHGVCIVTSIVVCVERKKVYNRQAFATACGALVLVFMYISFILMCFNPYSFNNFCSKTNVVISLSFFHFKILLIP